MLSGIKLVSKEEAERLEAEDRKNQKKEHKHKHKKKHKKEKKDRKRDIDSDDSPSPPPERQEGAARNAPPKDDDQPTAGGNADQQPPLSSLQREDWMTSPMGRSIAPPVEKEKEKEPSDEPKVSARELNPDLRKQAGIVDVNAPPSAAATGTGTAPAVGDGGASWRMKALRRAQSQAGEEGKGLSDVVAERWGSLGNLTAELTQGAVAHGMAHAHAARDRRREAGGGGGDGRDSRSSRYMSDVKSTKSQMRRPSEGDLEKMSWRREKERSDGERRSKSRSSADERGGEERRVRPPMAAETNRNKLNNDHGGGVEAVLKAAAPELNTFKNDGSFLDQFAVGTTIRGQEEKKEGPAAVVEEMEEDEKLQAPPSQRQEYASARPPLPSTKSQPSGSKSNNLSAAAMLRARLGGGGGGGRQQQQIQKQKEETVILPLIDASGRAAPGAFGRESASAAAGASAYIRPIKRVERYDQYGQRKRYFADDDALDLDTLVKRTKYGSTEDIDATMARNIAKSARFKEGDLDADAEYDWDAGLDLADGRHIASKDARRRGSAHEEVAKKEKQRQIREYNKLQSALDRCTLCFTSKIRQKHLTLAIGTVAYLALPARGRLVPGHCQIIPAEHVASTRSTDESTWTEIRNFKKCLLQMFTAQGMDVIFIETALGVGGGGGGQDTRAHAVVDCIPVPQDVFAKAPMYFRKAVDDATSEWSQHAAKKMIDTSQKGLRGAIPPNFPYFHVEFGLGSGFVHVIDNPEEFDRDLGRSVLIGLLRLPEEDMHRRAKKESQRLQEQWAVEFRSQFDEFDWTKQL